MRRNGRRLSDRYPVDRSTSALKHARVFSGASHLVNRSLRFVTDDHHGADTCSTAGGSTCPTNIRNNPIICRIHARLSLAHAVRRPVSISSGRNRCPATQWPTGTDPRIHQLHERSQFSSPDNFPSARSLLLIATSAPLHDHQPPVRRPPYPVFMPPNYPSTASPAPCSRGDPPDHPGFRSPRGPGRLPFFHETGSRSERTGAIRPQQHLLC